VIYFIRDTSTGHVKIGHAEDPWKRLSKIQSDCPGAVELAATEPGGLERERALHQHFAAAHLRGEWFLATAELRLHVSGLGRPEKPHTSMKSRSFWGKLTDLEVSELAGVGRPMLTHIRLGNRRPSPELAIRLQRVTGRSAVHLVFGDLADEAASGIEPVVKSEAA
jgi:hypothetical protein